MKRGLKLCIIVMVLLALGAVGASAKGKSNLRLGLEFGNPNAVLIIRPAPFDFKIGYNFAAPGYLFFSADYRIVNAYQVVDILHFFLGVGATNSISSQPSSAWARASPWGCRYS
jgi:hypothetical protein